MTAPGSRDERRAHRLIGWYPRSWRERYGEEFCELLIAEYTERPRSLGRTINVACGGVRSRITSSGLAGAVSDPAAQVRCSLGWLVVALCAFLAVGVTMWSQLLVGWQWTSPQTAQTTYGIVVMSVAVLALGTLGAAAAVPVVCVIVVRVRRRDARGLVLPTTVAIVSAAVLVIGARHYENGWPGTGAHHWGSQGIVPGGVAAFLWAATLAITSYWAHPGALRSFPVAEVVWMALSPIAMVALGLSAMAVLSRIDLPARAARFEMRLGQLSIWAMALFLLGAVAWILDRATRPRSVPTDLFHVGAIDVAAALVMGGALALAIHAVGRGIGGSSDFNGV